VISKDSRHLVTDQVTDQRRADRQRHAGEKDTEERCLLAVAQVLFSCRPTDPLDLFPAHVTRIGQFEPVSQHDERNVGQSNKQHYTRERDVPRWKVVAVHRDYTSARTISVIEVERLTRPTDDEIVHDRQDPRTRNSIVRKYVARDGELGVDRNVAPSELTEERCNGAAREPILEGVKDELTIRLACSTECRS
jgi:hypothetical protein